MALEVWLLLLAICLLLVVSALFSGSETALTAAQRPRIHRMVTQGNSRAKVTEKLIANRERLIGVILLGNNLVNILGSALATSVMLQLFGEVGVVYATLMMTALVVVFAEVLPKTYAIAQPERVALAVAPVMRGVVWLFSPIERAVQVIVQAALRLLGYDPNAPELDFSAHEELRGAVDLHHQEGAVRKRERDMIGGILDLDQVSVADVMVHRRNIHMVDAGMPPAEIIDQVLSSPYTRVPVYAENSENIVGVLHAKDLLRALTAQHGVAADGMSATLDLQSVMVDPWFVPEATTLRAQLMAFLSKHNHFALVVDEYGALMGLVTLEDILEEIVGEIADEHDIAVRGVRPEADGSLIVDGKVAIRDLNREFDWRLPDEEATTIAGLVIHEAQAIPEEKQTFIFYGFKFEVLRRQRNAIAELRVTPPAMPR